MAFFVHNTVLFLLGRETKISQLVVISHRMTDRVCNDHRLVKKLTKIVENRWFLSACSAMNDILPLLHALWFHTHTHTPHIVWFVSFRLFDFRGQANISNNERNSNGGTCFTVNHCSCVVGKCHWKRRHPFNTLLRRFKCQCFCDWFDRIIGAITI